MMTDERTKVFLLLDEAEKRQKTAEQQQAALQQLLQANQTAGTALDQAIATLPSTVQRAVDSAVLSAVATAMNRAAQTAAQALDQATVGPVERLNQAVTRAQRAVEDIEQASRGVTVTACNRNTSDLQSKVFSTCNQQDQKPELSATEPAINGMDLQSSATDRNYLQLKTV